MLRYCVYQTIGEGEQMKVVQLNAVCNGSTGKIAVALSDLLTERDIDNRIFYTGSPTEHAACVPYMSHKEVKLQALRSKVLGTYGFHSKGATRRLLNLLDEFAPDLVHIHNIHGHNCHLGMLFSYLKEKKIRVLWTFHDCWAFTGYCPHFIAKGCEKWQTGCHHCSQRRQYSFFFDRSSALYHKKKALLTGLDLTIVTPSQWMADLIGKSFLKDCPVHVINNGIDLEIFRPRAGTFRRERGLEGKYIILGVANYWSDLKGLDSFIALAKKLDERYVCVLVGTDDQVDQRLPDNIISIHRTQNQQELAEIYSDADVFFNPTVEDTYPTVNMEAIACGTPVVTYRTGGSPEIVTEGTGFVIDADVDAAAAAIEKAIAEKAALQAGCAAAAARFNKHDRFLDYIKLYTNE